MACLKVLFVFVLFVASSLVVANPDNTGIWEKAIKQTCKIMVHEAETIIKALQSLEIKTPASKVQLAQMVNNYIASLDYAIYSLNVLIPNLTNDIEAQKFLTRFNQELSKRINGVQQSLHGDPEVLKAKIIACLDATKGDVLLIIDQFKISNGFTYTQMKNAIDQSVYTKYKLKLQAAYFKEPNKVLDAKIREALVELENTIRSLPNDDKGTEIILRHLMVDMSTIVERSVHKLKNWMAINAKDTKNVEIVKQVSRTLSDIYDKLTRLATAHHTSGFLKLQLHSVITLMATEVQILTHIEYADNLGGQEFIRDTIFSTLAIAVAYSDNLKS